MRFFIYTLLIFNILGLASQKPLERIANITGFTSFEDTVVNTKPKVMFAPIVFYTPDTRWGLGGVVLSAFHLQNKQDSSSITRMSYVKLVSYYTLNKQYDAFTTWNIFTPYEKYLFKGEFRFRKYPDRFYGLGNTSNIDTEEKYQYNLLRLKTMVMRRFGKHVFLGLDYEFEKEYNFSYEPSGQLNSGNIPGYQGGIGSALGFVGVYDSRDNVLNAYKGTLAEFSSFYFTPVLGSTFSFFEMDAELKHYIQIKPKHILAFHSKMRWTNGAVPFLDMSRLGGEDILRGYPGNRFIDNNLITSQIEYRFPLIWRLGMTAFAGAGDVFSSFSDLSWSNLKPAAGLGLRLLVNPKERVNIRFDYARGREGGYFYFSVSEAF